MVGRLSAMVNFFKRLHAGFGFANKRKVAILVVAGGVMGGSMASLGSLMFCESRTYDVLVMPTLHKMGPEKARKWMLKFISMGLCPSDKSKDVGRMEECLGSTLWDIVFSNPVGLAAGFDTNGTAYANLLKFGFSFVEVGSVTPKPQSGGASSSDQPLEKWSLAEHSVLHRYGIPSDGFEVVSKRMEGIKKLNAGVVGVNICANADSKNPAEDFAEGVRVMGMNADYLVLNVSSPDVSSFSGLQDADKLEPIMRASRQARDALKADWKPPLLLKVSPDTTAVQRAIITLLVYKYGFDGLVVGNSSASKSAPGYAVSGGALTDSSTACVREFYRLSKGKLPIIACGGALSSRDVYAKIRAGACLVQMHSAFPFVGPALVPRIRRNLWKLIREDGFENFSECIGLDAFSVEEKKALLAAEVAATSGARKKWFGLF